MTGKKASFLGLGNMGTPIATNLSKNGVELFVYNRTKEKADPLLQNGCKWLEAPSQAFEKAPIAFTMLANDHAVEELTEGPNGLLAKAKPGCIHVSLSTISPDLSSALAAKHKEKGVHFIASPVFGRPDVAASHNLKVCIAGDKKAKDEVVPYLQFIGQKIYDFGDDPASANIVKLIGNFLIFSSIELMSESFALAQKAGIPVNTLQTLLSETFFTSPILGRYGNIIMNQDFTPAGFKMTLGLKDIDLIQNIATRLRAPMPIASLLHNRLITGLANKREDLDWSAIALNALEDAGIPHQFTTKDV